MLRAFLLAGVIQGLPPMRWDISSCLENKIRAEDNTRIIVSQSFPNPIQRGWNCEYRIFSSDGNDKIVIEFQHFSMTSCALQNLTITDDKTGRTAGPYCNTIMPPVYVSDSSAITIKSYTGETDDDMDTEGYMFTYKRVDADYGAQLGPPSPMGFGMFNLQNGVAGGRPAFPNYGSGTRQLPPSGFGVLPSRGGSSSGSAGTAFGVPVIGQSGQQTTVYRTGNAPGGVIYPEGGQPIPKAPQVRSNLPGGQTEYIQPNYEKNQKERDLIDIDNVDDGWKWTIPKIIGIAAGGLVIAAVMAVMTQYYLRHREKKLARKLRGGNRDGDSSSQTSFTSFDSIEAEREKKRQKRRHKRRRKPADAASLRSNGHKIAKAKKDLKSITDKTFDEKVLKNAERAIELQKLHKKLAKYT